MSSPNFRLTTPDLVLLGLFTERERHGYELNAELERREVRDWAGISRPQIYYSLKKLAEQKLIEPVLHSHPDFNQEKKHGTGPERQVYRITEAGRTALEHGLAREEWATQKELPPFLTWFALCPYASPETVEQVLVWRTEFLTDELREEKQHLAFVQTETEAPREVVQIAELMVSHKIARYESELEWLAQVRRTLFP